MSERFDDEGLRQAYAPRLRRPAAHGPECPAPDALLAAVRGEGPEAERLRVLDHALSCAACRPELALLHTVSGGASTTRPVATLPNRWRRLAPLALAASVLIAVGIFGAERFLNRNAPEPTRSAGGDAPVLAAPADRAALSDGTVGFAWHPMPGALRYTLEARRRAPGRARRGRRQRGAARHRAARGAPLVGPRTPRRRGRAPLGAEAPPPALNPFRWPPSAPHGILRSPDRFGADMPAFPRPLALAILLAAPGAFSSLQSPSSSRSEDPRAVVRQAALAAEGDSAPRVGARWTRRLGRDSADRAAALGLATLARLTYDYPTAERLYTRLIAAGSAPDRITVYARLGLAEAFEARSITAKAAAEYTRAREEARGAGVQIAEGEALLRLTMIRGRLRGVAVAEATLDSASGLIPDTTLALRAWISNRRAILYALRGRADAQQEAEAAIALARRAGDLRGEAEAFLTLGKVIQYRNAYDSARVVLRHAEALYLQARNRSALASSLIWQAQTLGGTGRFGEMREVMQRALVDGEATHNPGAVGDAYRAFGVLGIMLGDFASAADNLKRSADISVQSGDSSGLRTTQGFLADVLLAAGDTAGARRLVLELIARATQPRQELEYRSTLAAIAIQERDWPSAERALAEAHAVLPRLPAGVGRMWLLHDEGRLAMARGDLPGAERLILEWLGPDRGPTGDQMRYDAHLRLADIYVRRGDVARAEREVVIAADELDHWRARLNDAELRVLFRARRAAAGPGAPRAARPRRRVAHRQRRGDGGHRRRGGHRDDHPRRRRRRSAGRPDRAPRIHRRRKRRAGDGVRDPAERPPLLGASRG